MIGLDLFEEALDGLFFLFDETRDRLPKPKVTNAVGTKDQLRALYAVFFILLLALGFAILFDVGRALAIFSG